MGVKKTFNIILTKFNIALKENKEYKGNFWSSILADLGVFLSLYVFYLGYKNLGNDFLNWSSIDFLTYLIIINFFMRLYYLLRIHYFSKVLLSGKFQTYLTKPTSSYLLTWLDMVIGSNVLLMPIYFVIGLLIIIYLGYSNILLGTLISLFGIAYTALVFNTIQSFSFFIKEMHHIIVTYFELNRKIQEFTPKPFLHTSFEKVAFLLPTAISGFFTIEAFNNRFDLFFQFLPYVGLSTLFFLMLLYFNWKQGIKKYEAFG
jgi:ABC-type uncharacterized transport system permease subunit